MLVLQVVLHLAAEWRPEALRQSPEQARQLNVDAAGRDKDQTGRSMKGFVMLCHCEKNMKTIEHVQKECAIVRLIMFSLLFLSNRNCS